MKKEKMKIAKSLKTYIRREKASIRRAHPGDEEQHKLVHEMYERLGLLAQEKDENK